MKIARFAPTLLALPLLLSAAQPAVEWDGSQADYFSDDDGPFTLGFQFRAESDIIVTSLGAFDYLGDGLATPHTIGIWTLTGRTPIAVATLPAGTASPLLGQFRYVDIPGLSLSANTEYIIGASDFWGSVSDIYAGAVPLGAFSTSPAVSYLAHREGGESAGLVFPSLSFDSPLSGTFGANFQFVPVPEPSTWALLVGGGILLAGAGRGSRRNVT